MVGDELSQITIITITASIDWKHKQYSIWRQGFVTHQWVSRLPEELVKVEGSVLHETSDSAFPPHFLAQDHSECGGWESLPLQPAAVGSNQETQWVWLRFHPPYYWPDGSGLRCLQLLQVKVMPSKVWKPPHPLEWENIINNPWWYGNFQPGNFYSFHEQTISPQILNLDWAFKSETHMFWGFLVRFASSLKYIIFVLANDSS